MTVATIEELDALVAQVKAAQQRFAEFSQEQVDVIFRAAALAAADARIPLARMAVEETGMGVLEDKVIKNHFASEYIYNAYKDTKTCGRIAEDDLYGTMTIAEPVGLICGIVPTTNPTSPPSSRRSSASRPATASSSAPIPGPGAPPARPRGWCWRRPWPPARRTASSAGSTSPPWN